MGSGALSDLPDWARDLLERGRVGRLGFADDEDHPRVLPITYAAAGDSIWSAIDDKPKRSRDPARLRYLRRRPQAALTIDRYDDNWDDLAWVQLLCEVEIIDASDAPDAVTALRNKYTPYLASAPPGPLLRLQPRRALWWSARPS